MTGTEQSVCVWSEEQRMKNTKVMTIQPYHAFNIEPILRSGDIMSALYGSSVSARWDEEMANHALSSWYHICRPLHPGSGGTETSFKEHGW